MKFRVVVEVTMPHWYRQPDRIWQSFVFEANTAAEAEWEFHKLYVNACGQKYGEGNPYPMCVQEVIQLETDEPISRNLGEGVTS